MGRLKDDLSISKSSQKCTPRDVKMMSSEKLDAKPASVLVKWGSRDISFGFLTKQMLSYSSRIPIFSYCRYILSSGDYTSRNKEHGMCSQSQRTALDAQACCNRIQIIFIFSFLRYLLKSGILSWMKQIMRPWLDHRVPPWCADQRVWLYSYLQRPTFYQQTNSWIRTWNGRSMWLTWTRCMTHSEWKIKFVRIMCTPVIGGRSYPTSRELRWSGC